MKITEEMLMAYADGELEPAQRARVEQAMAADPALAAQIAGHQRLRERLQAAMDPELDEAVPEQLLATLRAPVDAGADAGLDNVVALPDRIPRARRWRSRDWAALAAALVLGVGVGLFADRDRGWVRTGPDGGMVAAGTLAQALTDQLASTQAGTDPIQVGISFRTGDGTFCRTFSTAHAAPLAGLACRRAGGWHLQMLAATPASGATTYRRAGSALPTAIREQVEHEMAGEPLDADAEAAARRADWER